MGKIGNEIFKHPGGEAKKCKGEGLEIITRGERIGWGKELGNGRKGRLRDEPKRLKGVSTAVFKVCVQSKGNAIYFH